MRVVQETRRVTGLSVVLGQGLAARRAPVAVGGDEGGEGLGAVNAAWPRRGAVAVAAAAGVDVDAGSCPDVARLKPGG